MPALMVQLSDGIKAFAASTWGVGTSIFTSSTSFARRTAMWWDITRAVSSGKIQDGKDGRYVTQAIDPVGFHNVHYNHYGIAVILSIATVTFSVSALVSLSRYR
jgi:hypothetical protein